MCRPVITVSKPFRPSAVPESLTPSHWCALAPAWPEPPLWQCFLQYSTPHPASREINSNAQRIQFAAAVPSLTSHIDVPPGFTTAFPARQFHFHTDSVLCPSDPHCHRHCFRCILISTIKLPHPAQVLRQIIEN